MKRTLHLAPALLLGALGTAAAAAAQDAGPPPNFADHVEPILDEYCVDCHRGSRARNGLVLTSVPKILAGGSSGAAAMPGDPDGSLLVKVIEHTQGPFMPPDDDKIPEAERGVIRAWIAGGARVDANDEGSGAPEPEAVELPTVAAGAAAMPAPDLSTAPFTWTGRGGAVTALAVSPGAPLVAVGGLGQVSLYALPGGERPAGALLAVLPFPEGRPERLSFASSGGVLLAAGGRPGKLGVAAGYDVVTGARLFTVGEEPETVLGADLTGDLSAVVLGGPDRVLRAFDPRTGASRWESKVHTDWVTAVAVSPDSALVVSGDRAGGLAVHEAFTGREFYRPDPSRGAITSIAWRADGALFAVTDEDGAVRVFDPEAGKQTARWAAHKTPDGGALGAAWRGAGVVTVGRDGAVRATDGGGRAQGAAEKIDGPALSVAVTADGSRIAVGDLEGRVHVLAAENGDERLVLGAYPSPSGLRDLEREEEHVRVLAADLSRAVADLEGAAASLASSVETESEAQARADAAAAAEAAARRQVSAHEAMVASAAQSVAILETSRAAAAALAAELEDREAAAALVARWDELVAASRAEEERASAALTAGLAAVEAAVADVAAASDALQRSGAARAETAAARDAMEERAEEARVALAAGESRAEDVRNVWEAQLSPGGTWRAAQRD